LLLPVLAALVSGACSSTMDAGADAPLACTVVPPTSCPDPPPHYPDIAPIINRRCLSCHWGAPEGPWPLVTYTHAADWHNVIRDQMAACSMPPPDSGATMTDEERVAIMTWILCGFLE
jgi:uncharacterized membrane protein